MTKKGIGTNTHGHGQYRRGKGRRGGKGFAGMKSTRWMSTIKGGKLLVGQGDRGRIGHTGKFGFTRGTLTKVPTTVNLSWVDQHFDKEADLTAAGIEKLLGSGKMTKAIKIKVAAWSKNAEAKVNAAGGKLEGGLPKKPEAKVKKTAEKPKK
jgi:large subunit ribosomal protein L15